MELKKIWVLGGGPSREREVSLRSSHGLVKALERKGYEVHFWDVRPGADFLKLPWLHSPPDLVVLGLHGTWGEDGGVQGFLDSVGIPHTGSGLASSSLCFNKQLTKKVLASVGVPVVPGLDFWGLSDVDAFFDRENLLASWESRKVFVKSAREGSTVGVYRWDPSAMPPSDSRRRAFRQLFDDALRFDSQIVMEEWIEGQEVTALWALGRAWPLIEIRPHSAFYDYSSKYTPGATEYVCPAPVDEDVRRRILTATEHAFRVLECADYARADYLIRGNEFFFLEINTLPGFTETSLVPKAAAADGLSFDDFVGAVVVSAWERHLGRGRA